MQDYPRSLYKEGVYMTVADAQSEEVAQADGWTDWYSDFAAVNGLDALKSIGCSESILANLVEEVTTVDESTGEKKRRPGRPRKDAA